MRISDWSSDVCPSDLEEAAEIGNRGVDLVGLGAPPCGDVRIERIGGRQAAERLGRGEIDRQPHLDAIGPEDVRERRRLRDEARRQHVRRGVDVVEHRAVDADRGVGARVIGVRSEEHTSELQSLMRISYAVFCLKKKKRLHTTTVIPNLSTNYVLQSRTK